MEEFFLVLFCLMFNKCVCTLLIHSAFVLGTTPKGDTGGGPNWACKRDCPRSSNGHWSFVSDRQHPQVIPSVLLDCSPRCGVFISWSGMLMLTGKIFVSETWRLCSISVLSGITMSIDSVQAY